MAEDLIQILEVRAGGVQHPVTITASFNADAGHAIFIALSEQLDRRRAHLIGDTEDALALRQQTELLERFAPLASSRAHAIIQLTDDELRACLVDLAAYRERVDGEHYQPLELRERIQVITEISPVLWDANATAAAVAAASQLSQAT